MEIVKVFDKDSIDKVADNLFNAVSNSVSEVKAMQQRKAAENVQLVIQALKKIESDIQNKFDGVTNTMEKRIASIRDGRNGTDGRDGRDGKDGKPGRDGAPGPRGPAGVPGTNGRDGVDGVSVTDAKIDFDGSLIISLSSGREINVGEVVAPDLAEKIKVITNGGGTSQSVLDALASLQSQVTALQNLGAVNYVGTWNASTNSPTITSGSGDKGDYYVVNVAGNTTINGQSNWGVGDWIIFNGTAWQKVDGGDTGNLTSLNVSGTAAIGTLGVGTSSPAYKLDVTVAPTPSGTDGVRVTTGGSEGSLFITGSAYSNYGVGANTAWLYSSLNDVAIGPQGGSATVQIVTGGQRRATFDSGGNLGIGTSTPNARLEVNGVIRGQAVGGEGGQVDLLNIANSAVAALFDVDASNNTRLFSTINNPLLLGTNAAERMRIDSSGNVGIGTSSPGALLDVAGGVRATGLSQRIDNSGISVNGGTVFNTAGASIALRGISAGFNTYGMEFYTGGSERMRLDTNGNLGIGTGSPSSLGKLVVSQASSGTATIALESQGSWNASIAVNSSGNLIFNNPASTERMRIDASGNVGIGTSSPQRALNVVANSSSTTIGGSTAVIQVGNSNSSTFNLTAGIEFFASGAPSSGLNNRSAGIYGLYESFNASGNGGALVFSTNSAGGTANAERMRLDSSGNLGIGTSAPAAKLDVNGSIIVGNIVAKAGSGEGGQISLNNTTDTGLVYTFDVDSSNQGRLFTTLNNTNLSIGQLAGTGGQVLIFTGASERMRIDSSGNVGIGTNSPDSRLTVRTTGASNGTVASRSGLLLRADDISTGSANSRIQWTYGGLGVSTKAYIEGGVYGADYLAFSASGSSESARINSSGDLLIGGTTSYGKLNVQTADDGRIIMVTGTTQGIRLGTNATGGVIEGVDRTGASSYQPLFIGGSDVRFTTANTERARIDSSGNLGIGTNSPTNLLDVNANSIRVRTARTPASATAAGNAGEICWDANYIYICTATNTWKRVAIATW